jgi:hypothetical protein
MNGAQRREELVAATARDEAEVERAIGDLKRAVDRPFTMNIQIGEQLARHPLSWLTASVLIGVWMGGRSNGHRRS